MANNILYSYLILFIFSCSNNLNSEYSEHNIQEEKKDNKNHSTEIKSGDIIFQTSLSNQSKAIQKATKSKYSHMGIIFNTDNESYVYEAIQPVSYTPLKKWIARGENQHYVIKRLRNKNLSDNEIIRMKKEAEKHLEKDYDLPFEWSDHKMYCSEYVWKIYDRALGIQIGKLEQIKDFDLTDIMVQKKIKERYGDKIPEDEIVISPESMYQSELLETIR